MGNKGNQLPPSASAQNKFSPKNVLVPDLNYPAAPQQRHMPQRFVPSNHELSFTHGIQTNCGFQHQSPLMQFLLLIRQQTKATYYWARYTTLMSLLSSTPPLMCRQQQVTKSHNIRLHATESLAMVTAQLLSLPLLLRSMDLPF